MATAKTFVQLVNDVKRESGADLDDVTSFANLTPLQDVLKNYTAQAYKDIQLDRKSWENKHKVANLIVSPRVYVEEETAADKTPVVGDVLVGEDTAFEATVLSTSLLSGAWASGTGKAYLSYEDLEGQWKFNEMVNIVVQATSVTAAATTATVTIAGGHGLPTPGAGQSITVSGASAAQSDYNGTFVVATTPSATTFTYTMLGSPSTPSTEVLTIQFNDVVRIKGYGRYDFDTEVSGLFMPDLNSFSVQSTGGATAQANTVDFDSTPLVFVPRNLWPYDDYATVTYGRPTYFTRSPEGHYDFWPRPDQQYVVRFYYESSIHELTLTTDTQTEVPPDFQDVIVWLAVRYYADYDRKQELWRSANKRYNFYKTKMEEYLLPEVTFGQSKFTC